MSGIVQHKSTIGTGQTVSLTLDSPVTSGNLLIAVIGYDALLNSIYALEDAAQPSWMGYNRVAEATSFPFRLDVYEGLAQSTESYTLEVVFDNNDGNAKHLHLFEVSGYDTFDQEGINAQNTNAPSVGTILNTSKANEFVLAAFLDATHSEETFTAGSGYTAGETTNANFFSMFSEFRTISSVGQPSASASIPNTDNIASAIVTFYLSSDPEGGSGGGQVSSGPAFLGSVRVLGSAPSGVRNSFLGTVTVVGSAPAGAENPYLGSVVVGTPSGSDSNPSLGEVVVVGSVPAGAADAFLGTVEES